MASSKPPPSGVVPDRRAYRRIRAPIQCRPAGVNFFPREMKTVDVSLGGVRIYSSEAMTVGRFVKLDFLVPDTPPVTFTAEVMWIDLLPPSAPSTFDIGLRFVQLEPDAMKLLVHILGSENDWGPP